MIHSYPIYFRVMFRRNRNTRKLQLMRVFLHRVRILLLCDSCSWHGAECMHRRVRQTELRYSWSDTGIRIGRKWCFSMGTYVMTLDIKFAITKRQMAKVLDVSYGVIVFFNMRCVERIRSEWSELASDHTSIRSTVENPLYLGARDTVVTVRGLRPMVTPMRDQ